MKYAFENATGDETSPLQFRDAKKLGSFLVKGLLKWSNNNTGTAELAVVDEFTGVTVATGTVEAGAIGTPKGNESGEFWIPRQYRVVISATAGTLDLGVAVDGNA